MRAANYFFLSVFFMLSCQTNNENHPDVSSDMGTINSKDASDMGQACLHVLGHTVDLSVPCKISSKPDQDFGCLPFADAYCSGLAAQGCYISSHQSVVINSETISPPFDSLLDKGRVDPLRNNWKLY